MLKLATTAVLVAAAAIISGCTPSLDHVDSHPNLDHDVLREGGVVVLPAVSFVAEVGPLDAQQMLLSNVHRWRDEIAVRTDSSSEAEAVADAIAEGRPATSAELASIADANASRFVAVVVLHDYSTHLTETTETIVDSDGVAFTETTLEAEATLDGELMLVESHTGETWWHGDHAETDYEQTHYDETDWFIPGYPDPPSASALTDDLLEAMVRNWPRER